MEQFRKQFVFDLKADKASPIFIYYNSLSGAYDDIRRYMETNGFLHRQGSSYISKTTMDNRKVRKFLKGMCKSLPWLAECSKAFDITDIGKQHDLLFDIEEACDLFSEERKQWAKQKK